MLSLTSNPSTSLSNQTISTGSASTKNYQSNQSCLVTMNPTLTLLAVLFATPSLVFSDEMVPVSFMLNDKTPGIRVSTGDIAIKPLNYCSDLTKSAAVLYGASYHEKTGEKVENPRRVCGYTIKNGCCAFFRYGLFRAGCWALTIDIGTKNARLGRSPVTVRTSEITRRMISSGQSSAISNAM